MFPPEPWYVHLDVDVVDPAELPPLRFPAPGGPSVNAVTLALRTLADVPLTPGPGSGPRLPVGTPVRNALSLMLTANGEPVAVLDGDGRVEGLVTLAAIEQLLSDEAGAPSHGASPAAAEPRTGTAI